MEQNQLMVRREDILNKMTRKELVQVNREVLRRVKVMDDLERLKASAGFFPGDRVTWADLEGRWKVSAKLLKKIG